MDNRPNADARVMGEKRSAAYAVTAALILAGASATQSAAEEVGRSPDKTDTPPAAGQSATDEEALAKQLSNPVASLISVPLQSNFDFKIGPDDDGFRYQLNVQPVVPISLGPDWNVISRTIAPIVYQDQIFPGAGDQFGLGDITQSVFFSPKKPLFGSLIFGAGPAFLIPTATDDLLGTGKLGLGRRPSA